MSAAGLYDIRVSNEEALDLAINRLMNNNPELTVDDCLGAIFAVGLISVSSTITLVLPK